MAKTIKIKNSYVWLASEEHYQKYLWDHNYVCLADSHRNLYFTIEALEEGVEYTPDEDQELSDMPTPASIYKTRDGISAWLRSWYEKPKND